VLDINMPGCERLQVCEAIRAKSRIPIMMLGRARRGRRPGGAWISAPTTTLTKPFSPHAPRAHQGVLRRAGIENTSPVARVASRSTSRNYTVRHQRRQPGRLTQLELRLLQMLLANAGRTVTSDRLLVQVWVTAIRAIVSC